MSIYSEILLRCSLRADIPETVLQELKYWLGLEKLEKIDASTWYYGTFGILDEGVHYLSGASHRTIERHFDDADYALTLFANDKYYDKQIEKFLLRVVEFSPNDGFVGYTKMEIEDNPTLIFFHDGKVIYRKLETYVDVVLSNENL